MSGTGEGRGERIATRALVATAALLFLAQFAVLVRSLADLPFWDEWDLLATDGIAGPLSGAWLLEWHNGHRIASTRLLVWVLYRLNGWNTASLAVLSYFLFGQLLVALGELGARCVPRRGLLLALGFLPFLLNPLGYENHVWGFQSQIHLALLFGVLAVRAAFLAPGGTSGAMLGGAAAALALGSQGAGLPLALAWIGAVALRRLRAGGRPARGEIAAGAAVLLAVALWARGFDPGGGGSAVDLSARARFLVHLAAFGFGFESAPDWVAATLALALALAALGSLASAWRARDDGGRWSLAALQLASLGTLLAIAAGRASLGIAVARSHRYVEFASLAVFLAALGSFRALERRPVARLAAVAALWSAAAIGFADDWSFGWYRERAERFARGRACVARYYRGEGPPFCPTVYHGDLGPALDRARRLGLSFTRNLPGAADGASTGRP